MAPRASSITAVGWVYDLILSIFATFTDLFFREVQVRGAWRVPSHGSVILVAAPHANQFVDSVILMRIMRSLNRRISWLMAEKSFRQPFIGTMATLMGAVPVTRAMDNMKTASGTVYLPDPDGNPRLLRGIGTRFDGPDFGIGWSLYLPTVNGESHKLDIAEIYGPEELLLKTPPTAEDALFQLTGRKNETGKWAFPHHDSEAESSGFAGSKFKVAPYVDQTQVYNAVFEKLKTNGCIGIFPEGGSHDRPEMLPLKAGIAIMALGALGQGSDVTVVPVGLNYFHAHKFRSRAVVEFGDSIDISPELVNDYKSGKRRETVSALLSAIYQSLTAVTMSSPDFETLMLIHAARRLYSASKSILPLSTVVEINRRLLKGYTQYRHDPQILALSQSITQYTQNLHLLGLRDHQVTYAHFSTPHILSSLLYRLTLLTILSLGTLPGLLLFSPVFLVTRHISHKKTASALAASTVKLRGNDVMATWKILVAVAFVPLLYTIYTLIFYFWTRYNRINSLIPPIIPTWTIIPCSYILFTAITLAALRLGEVGMDILKSLRPLVLCLSPASASSLAKLRTQRAELSREVTEIVNTLGPDLFPDCEAAKLPQPRGLYRDVSPECSLDDLVDSEFFSQV